MGDRRWTIDNRQWAMSNEQFAMSNRSIALPKAIGTSSPESKSQS
ncbi:MAG: hypothetical protein ACOYMA_15050 [Bacteroidia bacterium]